MHILGRACLLCMQRAGPSPLTPQYCKIWRVPVKMNLGSNEVFPELVSSWFWILLFKGCHFTDSVYFCMSKKLWLQFWRLRNALFSSHELKHLAVLGMTEQIGCLCVGHFIWKLFEFRKTSKEAEGKIQIMLGWQDDQQQHHKSRQRGELREIWDFWWGSHIFHNTVFEQYETGSLRWWLMAAGTVAGN